MRVLSPVAGRGSQRDAELFPLPKRLCDLETPVKSDFLSLLTADSLWLGPDCLLPRPLWWIPPTDPRLLRLHVPPRAATLVLSPRPAIALFFPVQRPPLRHQRLSPPTEIFYHLPPVHLRYHLKSNLVIETSVAHFSFSFCNPHLFDALRAGSRSRRKRRKGIEPSFTIVFWFPPPHFNRGVSLGHVSESIGSNYYR